MIVERFFSRYSKYCSRSSEIAVYPGGGVRGTVVVAVVVVAVVVVAVVVIAASRTVGPRSFMVESIIELKLQDI